MVFSCETEVHFVGNEVQEVIPSCWSLENTMVELIEEGEEHLRFSYVEYRDQVLKNTPPIDRPKLLAGILNPTTDDDIMAALECIDLCQESLSSINMIGVSNLVTHSLTTKALLHRACGAHMNHVKRLDICSKGIQCSDLAALFESKYCQIEHLVLPMDLDDSWSPHCCQSFFKRYCKLKKLAIRVNVGMGATVFEAVKNSPSQLVSLDIDGEYSLGRNNFALFEEMIKKQNHIQSLGFRISAAAFGDTSANISDILGLLEAIVTQPNGQLKELEIRVVVTRFNVRSLINFVGREKWIPLFLPILRKSTTLLLEASQTLLLPLDKSDQMIRSILTRNRILRKLKQPRSTNPVTRPPWGGKPARTTTLSRNKESPISSVPKSSPVLAHTLAALASSDDVEASALYYFLGQNTDRITASPPCA